MCIPPILLKSHSKTNRNTGKTQSTRSNASHYLIFNISTFIVLLLFVISIYFRAVLFHKRSYLNNVDTLLVI